MNLFIYFYVRAHLPYWFVYPSVWYLNILILNEYIVFVDLSIILYLSLDHNEREIMSKYSIIFFPLCLCPYHWVFSVPESVSRLYRLHIYLSIDPCTSYGFSSSDDLSTVSICRLISVVQCIYSSTFVFQLFFHVLGLSKHPQCLPTFCVSI